MGQPRDGSPEPGALPIRALRLFAWHDRAVVAVALLALVGGFGQFGAVAALGDVARTFGHQTHGTSIADQAGLSGTVIGVGLAVIRLASLGALPLAALGDRFGRRATMLATCAGGLGLTVATAASPSFWWFVAVFALGRPLLTATTGIAQVAAAELTASSDRAKAVALIAAGYGVGAGTIAVVHSLAGSALGFRGVFALSLAPLALLPLVARWVVEPERYSVVTEAEHQPPVLGPVEPRFRRRLFLVAALAFAISVMTGPANSLVFLYAQNVRHVPGTVVSAMVVAAGISGLAGLLSGRWLADRLGRRPTIALAMAGVAGCGVLTYSGSRSALVSGYILAVLAGSLLAPAAGSLANELFPTSVRASVAGWNIAAGVLGAVLGLVVFGAVADAGGRFSLAAVITFLPVIPLAGLLWFLPETKGRELEDLWPSRPPG